MRLFVALDIPEAVRKNLVEVRSDSQRQNPK